MRNFIREVKKYIKFKLRQFIESRFFLFVLGVIIGSTTIYIYLVGKPYYNWVQAGLYEIEVYRASAEEVSPKVEQSTSWGEVVDENSTGSLSNESMEQNSSPQGIQALIARYFQKDAHIALAIAKAESNLKSEATNKNTNGSIDCGIFQINSVHNPTKEQCENVEENIKLAKSIYDKSGWGAWSAFKNNSFKKYL